MSAVVHANNGKVVAVFHANPGAVLGLPAVASQQPYSLSAIAREGSDVAFVSKTEFEKLLGEQPSLYVAVLRVLAAEVQVARDALARL